ncbi:hypothetical protein QVG61_02725 [Thiohalobacter sp. IOR34]|uniref:methyltransferase family protein n=1 Tax=Thiohalobacter sp. IOR34 TaxID=3057176 RepID=UPI0025B1FB4D|nr:hypothetical protein [Thiohalobacter sp. IOR34]WJW76023.1 hypothetical protein QVG61_02725 [Thiohalobacter sp. IOR34]
MKDAIDTPHLFLLAGLWLGYFLVHSLLASHTVKRRVAQRLPRLAAHYRLGYNLLALLLLIPPLWLTYRQPGPMLWSWPGPWGWLADGAALLALVGFWLGSRAYDLPAFLGLRPQAPLPAGTRLQLSPLHRYVRHPWYSCGLLLLWSRDMNASLLVGALAITLYLVIGSRLEERKLEREIGAAYREYRRQVPGLLPLPWRIPGRTAWERLRGKAAGRD